MPIYATFADMQARYEARDLLELTDPEGTGSPDQNKIETALARASALVEGYVASRYGNRSGMPTPPLLVDLTCTLAYHSLWHTGAPDYVTEARKEAIATLRDIAAGKIKLDEGEEVLPPRPDAIFSSTDQRHFSRDSMEGY